MERNYKFRLTVYVRLFWNSYHLCQEVIQHVGHSPYCFFQVEVLCCWGPGPLLWWQSSAPILCWRHWPTIWVFRHEPVGFFLLKLRSCRFTICGYIGSTFLHYPFKQLLSAGVPMGISLTHTICAVWRNIIVGMFSPTAIAMYAVQLHQHHSVDCYCKH